MGLDVRARRAVLWDLNYRSNIDLVLARSMITCLTNCSTIEIMIYEQILHISAQHEAKSRALKQEEDMCIQDSIQRIRESENAMFCGALSPPAVAKQNKRHQLVKYTE